MKGVSFSLDFRCLFLSLQRGRPSEENQNDEEWVRDVFYRWWTLFFSFQSCDKIGNYPITTKKRGERGNHTIKWFMSRGRTDNWVVSWWHLKSIGERTIAVVFFVASETTFNFLVVWWWWHHRGREILYQFSVFPPTRDCSNPLFFVVLSAYVTLVW